MPDNLLLFNYFCKYVKKMRTQKEVIKNLEKLADEIIHSGIQLRKVVLYGSYAKNQQLKWSDIDVAFVADEFKSIGFEDVKLFSKLLIKHPNTDSATHLQYQRFYAGKGPICGRNIKDGDRDCVEW